MIFLIFYTLLFIKAFSKVNVEVYLGSVDYPSVNYTIKQIIPAAKFLDGIQGVNYNFTLVYYSNTYETCASDGNCEYECPYGPTECEGEFYLACLLHFNPKAFDVLGCALNGSYLVKSNMEMCAARSGVDYTPIKDCATGILGSRLMRLNAQKTKEMWPDYFPWILVDNKRGNQEKMQFHLISYLCEFYNLNCSTR